MFVDPRDADAGLLVDEWSTHQAALVAAGWVFTEVSRYDPTVIVGLTPSGKAFNALLSGTTVSLTIAGNTRTLTVAKLSWLDGADTRTALQNLRASFPGNQR